MIDNQRVIEDLIAKLEDIVINSANKKAAEHEWIIFLDKHIHTNNEGYLKYRLRYLLSRYDDIKREGYE